MARKKKPQKPPCEDEPPVPDPASVVSEKTFESPSGKRYRIIKTTEVDEYEEKPAAKKRKKKGSG